MAAYFVVDSSKKKELPTVVTNPAQKKDLSMVSKQEEEEIAEN
jgi:hypothetical protein